MAGTRRTRAARTAEARGGHPSGDPRPTLRLYNTLTRQVEPIAPLEPGRVGMYSCGPTVYRYIHIGNLRTFTMADWIRRGLTYLGLEVLHVKNITDVGHMRVERLDQGEDKLVAQARSEGKSPWDIAAFYTQAFLDDEQALNILPAHQFPRATDHIPEMLAITKRLLERGHAYEVAGNVFFSVGSFPGYGQLSGNVLEQLGEGQAAENEMLGLKRAPEDFPLWKVAEEGRVMAWESPWGRGFPGWHIECSAMSEKYLGPQFDLHTGGVDNIFPHHEDERAQSEAANGRQFVRYWVHAQHLLADGLKMAKSTGNAYTLADIQGRGFEPLALRYFFTLAKYRSRINFTFGALRSAATGLARLREQAYRLADAAGDAIAGEDQVSAHPYLGAFLLAVCDDLNLPQAMAVVWRMVRDEAVDPALRLALLYDFDHILGFSLAESVAVYQQAEDRPRASALAGSGAVTGGPIFAPVETPRQVCALAQARAEARAGHSYATADDQRRRLIEAGYEVRDTRAGTWLLPRRTEERLICSSSEVPLLLTESAQHAFSVHLLAHNSRGDLERCVDSVARHAASRDVELVILDNGSTDDTLDYLRRLEREGRVGDVPVRILFADHNMGFAAGRNASFRTSLGRITLMLDTCIEVNGDVWTPIAHLLEDGTIGLVGPYGLVTRDLKEFEESSGPDAADVDAIEGYLMAFRREALLEVGPADEKFRFYRLMDIDYSLEFKKAGYRVVGSPELAAALVKHPHREWYSLSEEERATKSKKNFDMYWRRRHHCESLLVVNFRQGQAAPWGHDHALAAPNSLDPRFEHDHVHDGAPHRHEHKHWPDHSHTHWHLHERGPQWFQPGKQSHYVPHLSAAAKAPNAENAASAATPNSPSWKEGGRGEVIGKAAEKRGSRR